MLKDEQIQETVEKLASIYSKLQDRKLFLGMPGDLLAYTANKIASLKALLADVKRDAEVEAKKAETEYKRVKATAFKRLLEAKVSATAAATTVYAEEDVVEARNKWVEAEGLWNFVKSLVADGHDQVESLRSRLIDLQSSRKDESIR